MTTSVEVTRESSISNGASILWVRDRGISSRPQTPFWYRQYIQFVGGAMKRNVIRASLILKPAESGGRAGSLRSGYRSLLRLQGSDTDFGFELVLDEASGSEELKPGNAGTGCLSFWAADKLPNLAKGQQFEIREGTRIIGSGEIIDVDVA